MAQGSQITLIQDGKVIDQFELQDTLSVGRNPMCDIHLPHRCISRKHCILEKVGEEVCLKKESEFGVVKVNGQDCVQKYLKVGDQVSISPYILQISPWVQKSVLGVEELKIKDQENAEEAEVHSLDHFFTASLEETEESSERAKLIMQSETGEKLEYEVQKNEFYIGRDLSCDLVLEDQRVSMKNTLLLKQGNQFIVKDLDSKNGTFVDGIQIIEKKLIQGSKIQIGNKEMIFSSETPQMLSHFSLEKEGKLQEEMTLNSISKFMLEGFYQFFYRNGNFFRFFKDFRHFLLSIF